MLGYVDHVLALLPFEPGEYRRLRGPPCSYVGHPLTGQVGVLRPGVDEQKRRDQPPPVLLVLPGSRRSEIRHHMPVFGETLGRLQAEGMSFELVLPTMPHLLEAVREGIKSWPVQPRIVIGEQEKRAAFRIASAALAKSGTATLELATRRRADGYRLPDRSAIEAWVVCARSERSRSSWQIWWSARTSFRNSCSGTARRRNCRKRCATCSHDSPSRRRQVDAFARIDKIMSTGDQPPSVRAADIVLAALRKSRRSVDLRGMAAAG